MSRLHEVGGTPEGLGDYGGRFSAAGGDREVNTEL